MSPPKKSPTKGRNQRNFNNSIRNSTAVYGNDDLIDVNDDLQIFDKEFKSTFKSSKNSPLKSTISFSQKKLKHSPSKKEKRELSPQRKSNVQVPKKLPSPEKFKHTWAQKK